VLELSERSYRRGVHQALHVAAEIAALHKMSDIAKDLRSKAVKDVRTNNKVFLLHTILEQLNASEK